MTNKEQTISNLKKLKSFHNGSYGADINRAIKALEKETILDKIEKEINSPNRGTCDYFIVDRIEEIINKYKAESKEGAEE